MIKIGKSFKLLSLFVMLGVLGVGVTLIGQRILLDRSAAPTPSSIVIDTSASFSAVDYWKNLAQGGEERGQALNAVIEPISELEPEYIRFDHVYDFFDVIKTTDAGQITYDWSKLDLYVEDILKMGAKPFFSLGYTPPALSSTGSDVDMPKNLTLWREIVRATIERYSGRSGKAISDVYYEVWNEPDLFGNFKVWGDKNYLDLYRASALGAADAKNTLPFKFGGPAITAHYKNWFDALSLMTRRESLRFDFYSWHRYDDDLLRFILDAREAETARELSGRPELELIVSETGIDSRNNPAYDNKVSAVHSVASSILLSDSVSKVFHFEPKDGRGPTQYWGRWGIVTHESFGEPVRKPRHSALLFMNQMSGGRRLSIAGQGSAVIAKARVYPNGSIKVLVVNYEPSGKYMETATITLRGLNGSSYNLRKVVWEGAEEQQTVNPVGGQLLITSLFPAHSITLFEINPLNRQNR